jgi:hypothetical protein
MLYDAEDDFTCTGRGRLCQHIIRGLVFSILCMILVGHLKYPIQCQHQRMRP